MDKIVFKLIFNRKGTLNKRDRALVQVEAYLKRKRKYFSTKVYLTPDQWDEKKQLVKNHPNTEAINRMLYDYIAFLERKELEIWQQGRPVTLLALGELTKTEQEEADFLSFIQEEIQHASLKESTRMNHQSTLALLRKYRQHFSFADVTFEFVTSFEHFLLTGGYHMNTIAKHMKHLKRYVNIAINKEYIDIQKYAFRKYKIKTTDSHHTYLSPEDLGKLEMLRLTEKDASLQKILDVFLFCCYLGLRYSDFTQLHADNIVYVEKNAWLTYQSVKTKTEVHLPIYLLFEGKGLRIIEKYKDKLDDFFTLPHNSNVNKKLLKISHLACVTKNVSFHTARHTNATLLIYNGANITTVQKLLGHKNVRTTQLYANVMDMTIVRDLEKCYAKSRNG